MYFAFNQIMHLNIQISHSFDWNLWLKMILPFALYLQYSQLLPVMTSWKQVFKATSTHFADMINASSGLADMIYTHVVFLRNFHCPML